MAKVNALLHALNVGEQSVAGMARIDQERVRLAAEVQENLFPHVVGKGQVRPGTQYLGNSASNNQARLLPFIKSVDENAVLELSNQALRIWVDDALVTRPSVTSTVENGAFTKPSATITVTIASPAVVTWTGHSFTAGQAVSFKTTGALPTGMTAGTVYYVLATDLGIDTFKFSTTAGGAAVNTSGSQSGTHTGDAGWITTVTSGATSTIASNRLALRCGNRGSTALSKQQVSTSSAGTEHALRIVVDRGPILFRCGSTEGGDEYITEARLDVGTHSLAFTPTGSYWVQFFHRAEIEARVSSCTVESAGVLSFTAPWTTAELREIRHDQSGDITYLAHTNWQQRKIERRGDTSWSLVKYFAVDGPFTTGTTADVALTSSVYTGVGTLTADRGFFTEDHVGALFTLFHEDHGGIVQLCAGGEFTDAFLLNGVGTTTRVLTVSVTGTWAGSITEQVSYDGPNTGFRNWASSTGNYSANIVDSPTHDNIDVWWRIGFPIGSYTSGVASVSIRTGGDGGFGVVRVVAYNSPTSVDIEVLTSVRNIVATKTWAEGEWSDARGWPSSVAFHDGRLWWAGEDRFWASESDDFTAFNLSTEGDAGSIQRSVATGGAVNFINWMLPLQRLIFGTDGAESSARASTFDEPLTPTNIGVKDASTQGVAAVSPAKMDGRGVFIQRSRTKVFEILYSLERQDYVSSDLTRLNEDIGGTGLIELAVQRQPESYIWMVREDGECPILIYEPGEQVAGFIRFVGAPSITGDAEVESVCVLPGDTQDAVYLAVKRSINGSTVRFIEKLAKHSEAVGSATNKMADAATLTAGPVSSVTLAHLAGETGLIAWGTNSSTGVSGPITGLSANGSGVISLGATYTNVWVGLKYSWRYKTSKLAYGANMTALMQRKRVTHVGLLAANIHHNAVTVGPDFTTMRKLPRTQRGETVSETAVEATYDFDSFPFAGQWGTDSRVCMKGEAPYPATLLGLLIGVETNEK